MYAICLKANSSYLPIPVEAAPGEAPFVQLDWTVHPASGARSFIKSFIQLDWTGLDLTGLDRSSSLIVHPASRARSFIKSFTQLDWA